MPVFFSFLATTLLLTINIESVAGSIHLLNPYLPDNSKYYALLLMILIAVINYFVLYRNHEVVFNDFDLNKGKYKRWDLSIKVYITVSILILLVTLVLADLKNQGVYDVLWRS